MAMTIGRTAQSERRDADIGYETVPLGRIKPFKGNARKHSAAQIDQIAASIAMSGNINPIVVDRQYGILCGHGRYFALKKLGWASADVVVVFALFPMPVPIAVAALGWPGGLSGW